ncbi:hypothetical protein N9L02_02685 [Gammaproteobacteria bacterium]|nr:hypothetical protein [Gammaproteobacteria bacterium]
MQKSKTKNTIDLHDDFKQIKDILSTTIKDFKVTGSDAFNDSINLYKKKSNKLSKDISDYTREKPFKALAVCFAAGLVCGFLTKRR